MSPRMSPSRPFPLRWRATTVDVSSRVLGGSRPGEQPAAHTPQAHPGLTDKRGSDMIQKYTDIELRVREFGSLHRPPPGGRHRRRVRPARRPDRHRDHHRRHPPRHQPQQPVHPGFQLGQPLAPPESLGRPPGPPRDSAFPRPKPMSPRCPPHAHSRCAGEPLPWTCLPGSSGGSRPGEQPGSAHTAGPPGPNRHREALT